MKQIFTRLFATALALVAFAGVSTAQHLDGGVEHSIARCADSTVYSVGLNSSGQLGDGTTTNSTTYVQATGVAGATAVAAGYNHSMALLANGRVNTWGANAKGQLGNGSVVASSTAVQFGSLSNCSSISGGGEFTLVVSGGMVYAAGDNQFGQLGDNTTRDTSAPVMAAGITTATQVAAGRYHSLALLEDGTVMSWGNNSNGQLGDGTTTNALVPQAVPGLADVIAVAAGEAHSMALHRNGTISSWGRNNNGQLGDASTTDRHSPVAVAGISTAFAISCGEFHSMALLTGGVVQTWGLGFRGALGLGTTTNHTSPQTSMFTNVGHIGGGGDHSLVMHNDSTVTAAGFNSQGQLGDGAMVQQNSPVTSAIACPVICPMPVASFTWLPYNADVIFNNTSTNSHAWYWDYGDGGNDMIFEDQHTYPIIGFTFPASLTAYGLCGSDNDPQTITTACPAPGTGFTYSAAALTVTFTDTTYNADSWVWDFNFPSLDTSHTQNPVKVYSTPGTYTVCLLGTNACGDTASQCQVITVCNLPVAGFTPSTSGLGVTLSNSSTDAVSYSWDFGDTNTDTAANPMHTYASAGTYTITLVATNACGDTNSTSAMVTVCAPLAADFDTASTELAVNFTDQSIAATTWMWDFGDGNSDTTQNPSHTYAAPGTYTVCLHVTNVCAEMDSICHDVTVDTIVDTTNIVYLPIGVDHMSLYPNPAKDMIKLDLGLTSNMNATISVVSALGEEVYRIQRNLSAGDETVRIPTTDMPVGMYLLRIEVPGGETGRRFLKVE